MNAAKLNKTGFYASLILTVLTMVTFGFAMIAVPPSGPYCPGDCMSYPFADILDYYPHDYYWMYWAIFQLMAFIFFIIANHFNTAAPKKIWSFSSIAFGLIAVTILMLAYFIQFAVVPISLMKGQTQGIALLTQYNGHGIFVVMEELGYILMSISFFFLAFAFTPGTNFLKSIRWILFMPCVLTVLFFIFYTLLFGLDRDYRFEVATITINWLATITTGILLSVYYKSLSKNN